MCLQSQLNFESGTKKKFTIIRWYPHSPLSEEIVFWAQAKMSLSLVSCGGNHGLVHFQQFVSHQRPQRCHQMAELPLAASQTFQIAILLRKNNNSQHCSQNYSSEWQQRKWRTIRNVTNYISGLLSICNVAVLFMPFISCDALLFITEHSFPIG